MKLTIDFETRSAVDLKAAGLGVYANDPTSEILCLATKIDDDETMIWVNPLLGYRGDLPLITMDEIYYYLDKVDIIEAHNAAFEEAMWAGVGVKKYGWKPLPKEKVRCSMAKASYHALPRALGDLALCLGLQNQKDKEGIQVMLKMCKPRKLLKAELVKLEAVMGQPWPKLKALQIDYLLAMSKGYQPQFPKHYHDKFLTWHQSFEDVQRLLHYCIQDVETEHDISSHLPELPSSEQTVWELDREINTRGIAVDLEAASVMLNTINRYTTDLLEECASMTGGKVKSPKQVAALKEYINERIPDPDKHLTDVSAATVLAALKDPEINDPEAVRILTLRKELGMSSVAKYQSLIDKTEKDGRLRYTLQYHGAGTGRWSGKGVQLQNLPRGRIKDPEAAIDMLMTDGSTADTLASLWGDFMSVAASCIRPMFIAKEGCTFTCADFSNIEGRVTAWLANEEWKLEAFRAFDRGEGHDLYKLAYSKGFGVPVERVDKDQRQIGKVMELACLGAYTPVVTDSGLVPLLYVTTEHKVWDGKNYVAHAGLLERGIRETINLYGVRITKDHLVMAGEEEWVEAGKLVPFEHRDYQITPVYDLANCGPNHRFMIATERGPLIVHNCGYQGGKAAFQKMAQIYGITIPESEAQRNVEAWRESHPKVVMLWRGMEDAAFMAVANPGKVYEYRAIKFRLKDRFLQMRLPSGRCLHYPNAKIEEMETPWGQIKEVVTYTTYEHKVAMKTATYGGSFTENCSQAVARDVMAAAMLRLEAAGYPIVLTVHDEVLSEHPTGFGSVDEFCELMTAPTPWSDGLPVAAAGWRGRRYRK